ncbi:hypothetical protein [Streptomyces sp. NBC_00620]|uniref:hypothetical protein n=1 Tax=unclassified Streptomyces TaxID=2593676 RepID=UPI0022515D6B|nr:hypothetical protein [Streptomyces sp. NBC_00620]MCX4978113.1 hypothetical protein [Streptomyces sp. NBC_00620]WUC15634.1 hypothetical protein OG256_39925 [Streptomyces sp. NBC_00564]WUC47954.1 hypothetical protein OG266_05685 [Streptomyces sp. NBC_00554]
MPQQQPRVRTDRTQLTARLARASALTAGLALLPLATACSGGEDSAAKSKPTTTSVTAAAAAGVVAPAKVEVIANLTGCKPTIRIEADELRQGLCHTKEIDYLITTFPEDEYKQAWLDAAAVYGGKYLVGSRWIVSAKEPEMLEQFRTKLGGTIEQLRGIGPTMAPSSS